MGDDFDYVGDDGFMFDDYIYAEESYDLAVSTRSNVSATRIVAASICLASPNTAVVGGAC